MRDNGRIAFNDQGYAQQLWQVLGLQPALAAITVDGASACGLNPDIRIYRSKSNLCSQQCTLLLLRLCMPAFMRCMSSHTVTTACPPDSTLHRSMRCRYLPGQRFNRHYDDSVDIGGGAKTAYTLLVYLCGRDSGLQGGETVFYGMSCPVSLNPRQRRYAQ